MIRAAKATAQTVGADAAMLGMELDQAATLTKYCLDLQPFNAEVQPSAKLGTVVLTYGEAKNYNRLQDLLPLEFHLGDFHMILT